MAAPSNSSLRTAPPCSAVVRYLGIFAIAVMLSRFATAAPFSFDQTGSIATARSGHTATLLQNGKVLIVGGTGSSGTLNTAELYDPAKGTWSATGSLTTARRFHTATLLPNGKVLVAGGSSAAFIATAELYDPATGTWSATGSMATARQAFTATLLPGGKVLVAGGIGGAGFGSTLASAELYDTASGTWSSTGNLAAARALHTATLLPNGKVLAAGGLGGSVLASAEIYDPGAGSWSPTGALATARDSHTSTLLPSGKVLAVGGRGSSSTLVTAEVYDPGTGFWTGSGSLAAARDNHTSTLLPNGKVLVTGGRNGSTGIATAELYDPSGGGWSATASLAAARHSHTATLLPGGQVCLAGGENNGTPSTRTELFYAANGSWAVTAAMSVGRQGHTLTLLASGKALVAGGAPTNNSYTASAQLYDASAGNWTATGNLVIGRGYHSATLLRNGKVLAAGGVVNISGGSVALTRTTELYDPATGNWTATGLLNTARDRHVAVLLPTGKVLVAGGGFLSSAELFDPTTGTWTNTGSLNTARTSHTATLLPNGRVLVVGGRNLFNSVSLGGAEIYNPATGTWSITGGMSVARESHTATLLPNGRVLIAGGTLSSGGSGSYVGTAEVYDPSTGNWSSAGTLNVARSEHNAVLLRSGRVLIVGGLSNTGNQTGAEIYDPATNTWSVTGSLSQYLTYGADTLLPDGRALVTGGISSTGSSTRADVYDEGLGFAPASQPQITSMPDAVDIGAKLTLTGLRFRGLSQGSGGNAQDSATNYPLVQLRTLENGHSLWLLPDASGAWSETSFTSRALSGFLAGPVVATVFSNGIPSGATTLLVEVPPPDAPDLNATSDSGSSNSDDITNDNTPTFTVTGVSNGALVELVRDGNTATPVASGTPSAVCSGQPCIQLTSSTTSDGVHTFAARQTIAEGTSAMSGAISVRVDTVAPATPSIDLQAASDSGASQIDNNTNAATRTFDLGNTEASATVQLLRGLSLVASGTASGVTMQLAESASFVAETSYAYTARQVDVAGNIGSASTALNVVLDNRAPRISIGAPSASNVIAGSAVSYAISYTDPFFSVSTLAAGNVLLNATGTASATVTVSGTGATRTATLGNTSGSGTISISIAAGTAIDIAGNSAPTAGPSTPFTISQPPIYEPYTVSRYAGSGALSGSTDGPRLDALFFRPGDVAVDTVGNVYVADTDNHTIRKITTDGLVSTFAGAAGHFGNSDGAGSAARFCFPTGLDVDSAGNVYVADFCNSTVRKITPAGEVSTVAGSPGSPGPTDGAGRAARFAFPHGLAVAADGSVFVADYGNHTIRVITPAGEVSTFAGTASTSGSANGTGAGARFNGPFSVAVDSARNVYVADYFNHMIRKITPAREVTTYAGAAGILGSADGTSSDARFNNPAAVAVDAGGNVFVADAENHTIRKITAGGGVTTIAGVPGVPGTTDGVGEAARFTRPVGLAIAGPNALYVADYDNHTIRFAVLPAQPTPTPTATPSATPTPTPQPTATPLPTPPLIRLANISTRMRVELGDNVLIGGFIVTGSQPKRLLMRALGPSLPVGGALADPTIELYDNTGARLAINNDWKETQEDEIRATTVPPVNDRESAIVASLPANGSAYTVIVAGLNNGTGVGLVEVYDLDSAVDSQLANISTRGFVQTGDNVMIAGTIVVGEGTQKVLVRAIGPSLSGTPNRLNDPTLELYDGSGQLLDANDNWTESADRQAIIDTTVPPTVEREAAIVRTLPPGGYTAILRGAGDSTGVGLVEIYALQ